MDAEAKIVAHEIVRLIPRMMRKVRADMRAFGNGVNPSHFGLLVFLSRHDFSISELAEMQHVSLATISNSVSTLEDRGWVERVPSSRDRRSVVIRITGSGRLLIDQMHEQMELKVTRLIQNLDAEDMARLAGGMAVLNQIFQSPHEESGDQAASTLHCQGVME